MLILDAFALSPALFRFDGTPSLWYNFFRGNVTNKIEFFCAICPKAGSRAGFPYSQINCTRRTSRNDSPFTR